ncbi:MAG: CcmD family protein [Anaerolineae bacterium]|nr:CcmD family protein [Anaerolineae bacterium]
MGYLFGAYFVLWALTFGYLWTLGVRQRRLERELASLQCNTPPDAA